MALIEGDQFGHVRVHQHQLPVVYRFGGRTAVPEIAPLALIHAGTEGGTGGGSGCGGGSERGGGRIVSVAANVVSKGAVVVVVDDVRHACSVAGVDHVHHVVVVVRGGGGVVEEMSNERGMADHSQVRIVRRIETSPRLSSDYHRFL